MAASAVAAYAIGPHHRRMTSAFDLGGFEHLAGFIQDGVISRAQLRDLGATPSDVRRLLRRRDLTMHHPGIYVCHTGPLSWRQRAWAAVLHHEPAALADESALPHPPARAPIQVAVAMDRRLSRMPGVVVRRMPDFEQRLRPLSSPPSIRLEHAAIDVAARRADTAARFRVFADVCQTRLTSAATIADVLRSRARVPHRQLLMDLLDDLAEGACSVLERNYLLLERRHGLPSAHRQRRDVVAGRPFYRDVPYSDFHLIVELDGRPFHDTALARDRDFERDLDTAVASDATTVRLTYGQVCTRGCATIRKIAMLLERRGWTGPFRPCPACPPPSRP